MKLERRLLDLTVVLPLLMGPAVVMAEDTGLLPGLVGTSESYASDARSGLALGGWDPVSYRLDPAPRPGTGAHEAVWRGLAWRFASEANRAAFLRDPESFAPGCGGYDALAAAEGSLVGADPASFAVRDGRLYLFRSPDRRARFLAEPDGAARAERGWAELRAGLVAG